MSFAFHAECGDSANDEDGKHQLFPITKHPCEYFHLFFFVDKLLFVFAKKSIKNWFFDGRSCFLPLSTFFSLENCTHSVRAIFVDAAIVEMKLIFLHSLS
jgi:hypothetical protein